MPFSGMIYQKILNDTKQNIAVIFGVVEAAGSNPVTQTNANSVVMRKASYLEGWLAFCYLHNIYMSV